MASNKYPYGALTLYDGGHEWLRKHYGYDVAKYKGSTEYARIARGEDFWSMFKWDGKGYVVTTQK